MDKLDLIFEMQNKFDTEVIEKRGLQGIQKDEWIQKLTLAMMSELSELIDEVNFKWWKNPKEIDEDLVKGEIVDILHFFVAMCLRMGMSADELCERYKAKNQENFDRQHGKSQKKGYELDQTLNK